MKITYLEASLPAHFTAAETLIKAYMEFLGEDLCFQNIDAELADLKTMYGGQNGCLILAKADGIFVGMVALRKKAAGICEMKRLYVLPQFLGKGIGKELVVLVIKKATEMRFKTMILDTLQRLKPALGLYLQLGFIEVPAYYQNPLPEVVYMSLALK